MNQVQQTLRDSAFLRWVVLFLISSLLFSTYWFQDFFSGLKGLMESEMGITSEEYGQLLGFTTIANVFGMIIVGGYVLDKWGIRLAGAIFGGIATLGALIVALGAAGVFGDDKSTQLSVMIAGRILFGTGLEVICVVSTRTVVKWFKGYELALAMAINVGFGRLGSALAIAVSPDIAAGEVLPAVNFAATVVALSMLMFLIYLIFDIKIDRQQKAINAAGTYCDPEEEFRFSDLLKLITDRSFIYITLLCVTFYAAVFPFISYAPDLLVNKFGFSYELPEGQGNLYLMGSAALGNTAVYLGMFMFGLAFSLIPARQKNWTGRIVSFGIILTLFVLMIYALSDTLALWLRNGPKTASLIPLGTILFTPVFGTYVDKKGKAASLMIIGSFLIIFAHLALSVFNTVALAYAGLIALGMAFSLVPAAMWPSVAKIVAENRLGTAYATMFTVQNWGRGAFFYGIGAVLDLSNKKNLDAIRAGEMMYDYTLPILLLVACGVVSIYLSYLLKKADRKQNYGLELPT